MSVLFFSLATDQLSHGVLAGMRTLGRLGVSVHWAVPPPAPPAAYSRFSAGMHAMPAEAPEHAVVERLVEVGGELGNRPLLVPTDDLAARLADQRSADLRDAFRYPESPPGLADLLANKQRMHELCQSLGVPTPDTWFPSSRPELLSLADTMAFPVLLKGIDTTVAGEATGVRMVVAHDRDELLSAYDELEDPSEPRYMVQEYIPGGPDSVWMFNGYFDAESECRFGICGRKLRQSPPYTGATSLGVCQENPSVRQSTLALLKEVGYRGIVDIGFRYDARDARYKLLDVNPRLGSSFRLFVDSAGNDVMRTLYCDFTGAPEPSGRALDGRKWIRETSDVASALTYRRDGILSTRAWLGSFRGLQEAAWFAVDDPLPALRAYRDAAHTLMKRRKQAAGPSPNGLPVRVPQGES